MELREFDASGRKVPYPIPDSFYDIAVDTVIEAIGQRPDTGFADGSPLQVNRNGTLIVNQRTMETLVPSVFTGGDVTSRPTTVIEGIAAGQKAAASISRYIQELAPSDPYKRNEGDGIDYPSVLPSDEELKEKRRVTVNKLPAAIRNHLFTEVAITMNPEEAISEASRCLRCDIEL